MVAGCVPQGQPRNEFVKGLSVVGVSFLVNFCLPKNTFETYSPFLIYSLRTVYDCNLLSYNLKRLHRKNKVTRSVLVT